MRWVFGLLIVFLGACQSISGGSTVGSGPIQFSAETYKVWQRYLSRDPIVFAVTPDGRNPYYYYCREVGCEAPRYVTYVLTKCQERYKRECRLFAMRDQIVWQNPGNWIPPGVGSAEADASHRTDLEVVRIRNGLSGQPGYQRYRRSPGHKALIAMPPGVNGRTTAWGVAYGMASLADALLVAQNFCVGQTGRGARYVGCKIVEVNGETLWPLHKDDLTSEEMARLEQAGDELPAYRGQRPILITGPDGRVMSSELSYVMRTGQISFTFTDTASGVHCDGDARMKDAEANIEFEYDCGNGHAVSGEGRHSVTGKEVSLRGVDLNGKSVEVEVGPDPVLFP